NPFSFPSLLIFAILLRPPPPSTLFPYTTLFRSTITRPSTLPHLRPSRSTICLSSTSCTRVKRAPSTTEHLQRDGHHREDEGQPEDRKSTRLNSSHRTISYAVFCLKKKKKQHNNK